MNRLLTIAVVGQLIIQGPPKFPLASSSSTLNTSLIAYWKLDESSGGTMAVTRVDSQGSNDLTDNNTTASGTGIISNGADIELGNTEYLSIADNTDLSTSSTENYTFSMWVKLESKASDGAMIGKWSGGGYAIIYSSGDDRFRFYNSNTSSFEANAYGSPPLDTWIHVVAYQSHTRGKLGFVINNGTPMEYTTSDRSADNTADFYIGILAPGTWFFDGIIDEVGFWKKELSTDEISELYNSGAGKTCCPF